DLALQVGDERLCRLDVAGLEQQRLQRVEAGLGIGPAVDRFVGLRKILGKEGFAALPPDPGGDPGLPRALEIARLDLCRQALGPDGEAVDQGAGVRLESLGIDRGPERGRGGAAQHGGDEECSSHRWCSLLLLDVIGGVSAPGGRPAAPGERSGIHRQPARSISLTASGLFWPSLAALMVSVLTSAHCSSTGTSLTPSTTGNS